MVLDMFRSSRRAYSSLESVHSDSKSQQTKTSSFWSRKEKKCSSRNIIGNKSQRSCSFIPKKQHECYSWERQTTNDEKSMGVVSTASTIKMANRSNGKYDDQSVDIISTASTRRMSNLKETRTKQEKTIEIRASLDKRTNAKPNCNNWILYGSKSRRGSKADRRNNINEPTPPCTPERRRIGRQSVIFHESSYSHVIGIQRREFDDASREEKMRKLLSFSLRSSKRNNCTNYHDDYTIDSHLQIPVYESDIDDTASDESCSEGRFEI